MRLLHPIRRINAVIRSNLAALRQIESTPSSGSPVDPPSGRFNDRTRTDPTLAKIAAQFKRFDVEKTRAAYMIIDRRTADAIARLRPIPGTDRFELFYWSNMHGRWRTFGNMGRMKLTLGSAREIVENDPMFRIPRVR
jgi:hypothetical protein